MEELTLAQQIKVAANEKLQFRQNNQYAYVTDPELLAVIEAIAEVIEPLKALADNPRVTIHGSTESVLIHSQAAVAEFPETHAESNTTDGAGAHTDPALTEPAAGADGTKTVEQGTSNTPS